MSKCVKMCQNFNQFRAAFQALFSDKKGEDVPRLLRVVLPSPDAPPTFYR